MDEEKEEEKAEEKPEDKPEETPAPDTKTGDKPDATTLIDKANAASERLEAANKKQEELLKQQEELDAKRALGGQSEAGQTPAKPKELTPEEYAESFQRGEQKNPLK